MAERRITQHAIQRFIERVDRSATPADASRRIAQMVASGRVRPKPRSWTNCKPGPGTVFIYSVADPDACLVATRDAILSVVSRGLCAVTRRHQVGCGRSKWSGRRRHDVDTWTPAELEAVA